MTIVPPGGGTEVTVEVCTWLHQWKAVAIAVDHFRRRNPEAHVYDVRVEPLGRAVTKENGTASPGGALFDRYEW